MDSINGKKNEILRRRRKMMLVLPVILIPLMAIGFYALGGGRESKTRRGIALTKGLNMNLPDAKFDAKKKGLNKLGFYKQSEQDSIRLRESRKMDPYYGLKDSGRTSMPAGNGLQQNKPGPGGLNLTPAPLDAQAGELLRKLDLLKGVMNRQQQAAIPEAPQYPERPMNPAAIVKEQPFLPFPGASVKSSQGDPDLDKLNTLMDKVLRVRYPGDTPLRDTTLAAQETPPIQVLSAPPQKEAMTTLPAEDRDDLATGFIDMDEEGRSDSLAENMIAAVVDGSQTLISGETVAFRTAGEAMLGGIRVPGGTALSGKATLSGERLLVTITALRIGSKVIPVALEVVDMDGMTGIRMKGSINRDISKESAGETVGSPGITSTDASAAGQATAAGLQAAKTLLSRKIRLVRVGLPAGYKVLLRNTRVNR
jgi:hypothetical protein